MEVLMGQIHTLLAVLLCHVVTLTRQDKTFLRAVRMHPKCSSFCSSMSFECGYFYFFYVLLRNDANRAQDLQRFFNVGLGLNHLGKDADFPSFFLHVDPNLSGRKKTKKTTAITALSLEYRKIKS